jgi:hypothetical protein
LTEGGKLIVAASQELPSVGLVSHVPDDLVSGRLELVEQGNSELDDPKARANVAAGNRTALDQAVPDLLRYLGELVATEALEVFR